METTTIEQCLIGSALAGNEAQTDTTWSTTPDMIANTRYAAIWGIIRDHWAMGRTPTPASVLAEVRKPATGKDILDCVHASLNPADADRYARLVQEASAKRDVHDVLTRAEQLLQGDSTAAEVASWAQSRIGSTAPDGDTISMPTLIDQWYTAKKATGVHTPWAAVNDIVGLHRDGGLHVIGARPAVGKTLYGLYLTACAARGGRHVLYTSMEMPARELLPRLLSQATGAPLKYTTRAEAAPADIADTLNRAAAQIAALPIHISDKAGMSVEQVAALARTLHHKKKLGAVVVDHMQLLAPSRGVPGSSLREMVTYQSRALKELALGLDVPVFALSQLSRASEMRDDLAPKLADLRESGSIEQDADTVTLLSLPVRNGIPDKTRLAVSVAKNRHGATGSTELIRQPAMAILAEPTPQGR
jgi:replicative DNA helicase|nr:MAG TPA: DnaB-like replicative helicase [Caudoviricetes sp.]